MAADDQPCDVDVFIELVGDVSDEVSAFGDSGVFFTLTRPVLMESIVDGDRHNLDYDNSAE